MGKTNTKQILEVINNHQYEQLSDYLSDVNWLEIDPLTIIPQQAIRSFAKAIVDKEVRLDVMRFLETYAENYFRTGAETLVRHDYAQKHVGFTSAVIRIEADQYIDKFKTELKTQIKQLESSGEFSGEKFSKLKKRITELEKEINELKERNLKLEGKIYAYEHRGDGHYIPEKLINQEFDHVVQLLGQKQLITAHYRPSPYGYQQIAYLTWKGQYDLFGYFVDKISYELELRDSGGRLNWKLFRAAFDNFEDMQRAAKNAVSYYQNHSDAKLPEDADIIDEILQTASAYEAERQTKEKHT